MTREVSNSDLFDFMTKIYGELQGLSNKVEGMDGELQEVKRRVIVIEEEHGKKLDLLFDGYKQNSDKLDRIEKEVSIDEEIVFRKIK